MKWTLKGMTNYGQRKRRKEKKQSETKYNFSFWCKCTNKPRNYVNNYHLIHCSPAFKMRSVVVRLLGTPIPEASSSHLTKEVGVVGRHWPILVPPPQLIRSCVEVNKYRMQILSNLFGPPFYERVLKSYRPKYMIPRIRNHPPKHTLGTLFLSIYLFFIFLRLS